MPRRRTQGLTDRESEILAILWDEGAIDVEQVRQRLDGQPTANTVRTLLAIMVERGLVTDDGRDYRRTYSAQVPRQEVQRSALRRLVDSLFGGSPEEVILHLVDEGEVDADTLAALQKRATRRGESDHGTTGA